MANTGSGMQGLAILGGVPASIGALLQGYAGAGIVGLALSAGLFWLGRKAEQEADGPAPSGRRLADEPLPSGGPPPQDPVLRQLIEDHQQFAGPDSPLADALETLQEQWLTHQLGDVDYVRAIVELGQAQRAPAAEQLRASGSDLAIYFEDLSLHHPDYRSLGEQLDRDDALFAAFQNAIDMHTSLAAARGEPLSMFQAIDRARCSLD